MRAIINNVEYNVTSHYTEMDGALHLSLSGEFSIDTLKQNILNSGQISILDDNNQETNFYSGYNQIRQISIINDQFEIVLEFDNIFSSMATVQDEVSSISANIKNIQTTINNHEDILSTCQSTADGAINKANDVESSLQDIEERLSLYDNRLTDIEDTVNTALNYYTNLEQSLNSALERLDHVESTLDEIITVEEDPTSPESDQNM